MAPEVPFTVAPAHRASLEAVGLDTLEACLAFEGGDLVKAAVPGREIRRIEASGTPYYLKRISGRGVQDVQNEARLLEEAHRSGIPVPEPVAFGMAWRRGALITVALPATRSLESLLLDEEPGQARVDALARRLADLVQRLHGLGINHRDLYAGHILVDDEDELFLVDFGRAESRSRVPRRRVVKDLAALHFSMPSRGGGGKLVRAFLHHYLAVLGSSGRRSRMTAAIERKSRAMRRHAENKLARGESNIHLND